jgi:hypothetical protein
MQQLEQGQQANQLNRMKMEEAQAAAVERNALRGLDPTSADYESQLFRVNPTMGIAYRKERTTAEAQQATQKAQQAQALKTNLDNYRSFLVGVNDQPAYDAWRGAVTKNIPELANMLPAAFSSDAKNLLLQTADDISKRLTAAPALSNLAKLRAEKAALPLGDPGHAAYDAAIAKESQFAPTPLSDTARLIKERDALPLNDPNRALYDRQIRDLGATAQNARDRLAFDREKLAYERANPGKTIKEITQADGSTQVFAIDNRTGMATQVMMAGAPGAAPAGAGRGAEGVTGDRVGPGTPLVGSAKAGALTEGQSNAALFGSAMAQAQVVLDQVEKRNTKTGAVATSLVQGIAKYVPLGIGDKLVQDIYALAVTDPTKLFGPDVDQQKLGQAQLAFSIAYLRKTSGANFGASEVMNTINEYFPQIGEDASVTKQKSEARKRAIKGMKISAGKEGSKFIEEYEAPGAAGGGTPSANDPLGIRGK